MGFDLLRLTLTFQGPLRDFRVFEVIPIVSIVVPFFGLTKYVIRIP